MEARPGIAGEWACYHDRSNYYWAFVAGKKEEEAGLYAVRRGVAVSGISEKLKMPPPCRMLSHSPPCKHRFWSFCKKCCRNPVFRQVGHDRFDRQLLLRAYYEPHEVPFIIVCMGVHGLRRSMGAGYGPVFPG